MTPDVRKRLAAFAKSLNGPLGQIPLDRAIRKEIELFVDLRNSGATWTQIAQALLAVGVRRPDGGGITADHLRGAVSRQILRKQDAAKHDDEQVPVKRTASRREVAKRDTPAAAQDAMVEQGQPRVIPAQGEKTDDAPGNSRARSVLAKLARTKRLREG